MYFKLAARNIKKSYKDYSIYFLTLILAVCIFYSFNAINSQRALIDMKSSTESYISQLTEIMSGVSIFVSVILGSLIIYANNFLIKKRKKELGIYMTLGMGKRKISRILVTETYIVGAISLIAGLVLGMGASQVLSAFTLKLFEVSMDEYKFAISSSAICKTILYFGIMFLLVMIFNIFVISKYKIIDLLTAGRKNENIKLNKPFIYLLSFITSSGLLSFAYIYLLNTDLDVRNSMFKLSIVFAIAGTVLFFFSLAGAILYIINKSKKVYLKGLNIFIVKQINSKFNTNFISMSIICLMLFITILVLSTGISVKKSREAALEKITPFDASIILIDTGKNENLENILNKINFRLSDNEKCEVYNVYGIKGLEAKDVFENEDKTLKGYGINFVKLSDYNKLMKLREKKEVSLEKDEILIMSDLDKLVGPINERLKNSKKVNIRGKEFLVKNDKVIDENLRTFYSPDNYFTVVINDEFIADYKIYESVLNVMYLDKNREENDKKYSKIYDDYLSGKYKGLNNPYILCYSKDSVYSKNKGATTAILFIGIYLGIVFLITSMAVLALQQLSEASDSIERYRSLKRIGANKKMIDKTIFIQTLVYFSLPVLLALAHSIVGTSVVNKEMNNFNQIDIKFSALITALIFIVVYAGYFYTTYIGYKNIVKNSI